MLGKKRHWETGVCLFLCSIVFMSGIVHASSNTEPCALPQRDAWACENRLVAHAMGGISGYNYTNSREAFLLNYHLGHRVFEADLILTSDGYLVARHDWQRYLADRLEQHIPPEKKGHPLTRDEFMKYKIHQTYSPLDFEGIVQLLRQNKDAYLITDTKYTDKENVLKQFRIIVDTANRIDPEVLSRIVPQIYHEQMLSWIRSVYPFPSIVYTLYQTLDSDKKVIRFAKQSGIRVISVSRLRYSRAFVSALKANGILCFVHTVNSPDQMQQYMKEGVHGFWSDFVIPSVIAGIGKSSVGAQQKMSAGE